jgi:hypothetical protein
VKHKTSHKNKGPQETDFNGALRVSAAVKAGVRKLASGRFRSLCKAGAIAIGCFCAAPAKAQCNPPAPRLTYPAWVRECAGVVQARWRDSNPYRMPYGEYERMLWQMYDVHYHPERYPGLIGSACSPEGSGYMNPSGHAQICRGGRWTVQ